MKPSKKKYFVIIRRGKEKKSKSLMLDLHEMLHNILKRKKK